jgi:hypothetical protein
MPKNGACGLNNQNFYWLWSFYLRPQTSGGDVSTVLIASQASFVLMGATTVVLIVVKIC